MANFLEGLFGLFNLDPCKKYPNKESLYEGLKRQESEAIQCVVWQSKRMVANLVTQAGLPVDMSEDVMSEAVIIFLSKIQKEDYQYLGYMPKTYLIEVARRVISNYTRTRKGKRDAALGEREFAILDESVEDYFEKKEQFELVEKMLEKLGSPCKEIIWMRYIDGRKDEEIIAEGLTKYSTVESLKVKRSDCMKKLREISKQITNKLGFF
jgi:RNA polymerase sigma factor (sigma-70 family)